MNEESLFAAALDKATAPERQAFLDEACAGDLELRRRVERLLAQLERLGILDSPSTPSGWIVFAVRGCVPDFCAEETAEAAAAKPPVDTPKK
jgi:eukaryotic-like serine/threonine-protein kinase